MKCKKCKCELTDCNAYIRNSSRAKQLGLEADPVDHGYAYICLNQACNDYGKLWVKGLNFDKPFQRKMRSFLKNVLLHSVLAVIGGLVYMGIELLWRGHTHWSMGILGGLCFALIGLLDEWQDHPPLWFQMLQGAAIVTALELITGLIVNRWLGWNVWDYSDMPLNLWGQVCLPFTTAWFFLSALAVWLENVLHRLVEWLDAALWRLAGWLAHRRGR